MRGDFSRHTFDPRRHHASVLQQQGRVQLDADWNEQQLIQQHRDETTALDVIGAAGAPRETPGFLVTATGASLSISRGRFYLEGMLCENETDTLITAQPDLPGFALPQTDGVYLAYLEAWLRHESAAEQPGLRETALGGADTATRLRTVSQVKLLSLPTTGAAATCGGPLPEWNALLAERAPAPAQAGRLSARTAPEGVTADPACILPPSAGFKGLENQLYRVEIHSGGDRTSARFKWSRENGSVVTRVTDISGHVVTVESTGRDGKLAFSANDWVELSDDTLDLSDQHGALFQIGSIGERNEITLLGGPLPALDPNGNRTLRRWDQKASVADETGHPLDTADFITLEYGIQVHFEPGRYNAGDFWLVPARSAISLETGRIEWPLSGGAPATVLAEGTRHHFARLGIFSRAGGNWTALGGAGDCRIVFPPLTGLTASDVAFDGDVCKFGPAVRTVQAALDALCRTRHCACTILIGPGDDVAAAFARLGPNHDAMVCFQAGDYRITRTVVISRKGNLRVTGCGPATRLFSAASECVLRFENCASVAVENLAVVGGATSAANLNGAVTFVDCPSVAVAQCTVSNRGFGQRRSTCLTVRNSIAERAAETQARIVGCDFLVGHLQVGLLLVNVARAFVQDNFLRAGDRPNTVRLLEDKNYRARLRRNLLTNVVFGPLPPGVPATTTNASVTFNGQSVHFRTAAALTTGNRNVNSWTASLAGTPPGKVDGPHALFRLLETKANRALLGIPTAGLAPAIRTAAQAVLVQDLPAGMQGIVVAGSRADQVQIVNNAIVDFIQGVHVGVSRDGPAGGKPDFAGHVVIAENTVSLRLSTGATLERHGIFIGNFTSLDVRGNLISAQRSALTTTLRTEGIRVFGFAGGRLSIKDNHLDHFDVGVAFTTRVLPTPRLWVITHNLAANGAETVRAFRQTGAALASIRESIRGIAENAP